MRFRAVSVLAFVAVLSIGLASLASGQAITEYATPTSNSVPGDIKLGPDGSLWFTEFQANKLGRVATDGTILEVPLPASTCGPSSVAIEASGDVWYSRGCAGSMYPFPNALPVSVIGILSPSGNAIEYNVGGPPHEIAIGPDGNLWFAGGIIGRFAHDGTAAYFAPPAADGAVYFYPWSIVSGPDGNMWFTEFPVAKIGKVSMTGVITEYNLPLPDRQPQYITVGPDGALWFTANETYPSLAQLIERSTTSGELTEYVSPTVFEGEARIATGSDGNLWFTEPGGVSAPYSNVARVTPSGSFSVFATPTPDAGPTGIAPGPDGSIWFTEALASQIGRVAIGQIGSCKPSATVLCVDDLRFKVETQWQKPNDPAPSPGNAITLTNQTGYFWFFDPANIELVTKVLDGCSTNGHYWFFAGGLTNVGVQINVTDTVTGAVKPYSNAFGTPFQPIQDTGAFPCP